MKYALIVCTCLGLLAVAACLSSSSTPAQRHEAACLNDAITGALIGGTIGNQFFQSSSSRRNMAIAGGAMIGAANRTRYSC